MWDSDSEAEKALGTFVARSNLGPLAEIRCMGHGGNGPVIGEVWFSHLMKIESCVLRLFYWPQGVRRTSSNMDFMLVFLNRAGDYGLYSCRQHGTWRADLRFVRQRIEERWLVHPKVVIPVWPPGTDTPPEHQSKDGADEGADGPSHADLYFMRAVAKQTVQREREQKRRQVRYADGRRTDPVRWDARR